ncbi:MAG: phytanoyl-CoA dioxygenase family protein [Candidatus Eremiobacteraeota bacterium]|nr:phytanoyl-CoA dioxygenase family protein [Candidatus Eremiobacteraeota bacterium]
MSVSQTEAEEILAALGVGPATLADGERTALDRDGYVVLAGIVDAASVAAMRSSVDELLDAARCDPTKKHGGTLHLDGVIDAGPAFDPAWCSPRVLAAVAHVLGADFQLFGAGYRGPRPGYGAQALHADDVPVAASDPFRVATAIVPLVDFTEGNGATRVVPSSHRDPVRDASTEPGRPHPRERIVTARAGDAIVFNGHLWHSGTKNTSDARRDALQIVFRRRGGRGSGMSVSNATLDRLGTAGLMSM